MKPVDVQILNKEKQISADKKYEVECKATGSRPEATITWWKGSRQVHKLAKTVSRVSIKIGNEVTTTLCRWKINAKKDASVSNNCLVLRLAGWAQRWQPLNGGESVRPANENGQSRPSPCLGH